MDEIFQDYPWIQDFEADFPQISDLKLTRLGTPQLNLEQ